MSHKYIIEIPNSIKSAYKLDQKNDNDFWRKTITKKMHNVGVAFQILEKGQPVLVGWKLVTGHLVFYVKMDFIRKACWELDSHKTPTPSGSTFADVVLQDSICIALKYNTLTDLMSQQLIFGMLWNAYLKKQASCESSSFGSEFIAMKQYCEYLRELRYKLRMMGIPVEGCCYIYDENQLVLYNSSLPDSALKKQL